MPPWLVELFGSAIAAIGAIAAGPFLVGLAVVGYVAAAFTSILLSLSGWLTGLTIGLQDTILTSQNVIVEIGWAIVRDVANLGFVLAIIIIAFATILRFEEYGVKKLLPKLIAAAILVNFSYAIAAVFVNFSQTLTQFFFNKITDEHSMLDVGFNLLGAFGPQRVWSGSNFDSIAGGLGALTSTAITLITGPWLNTLFNLIMIFTMGVLAFMLLLRYLWLSFLVIISPIVWLFWVIPGLAGQFDKWWTKFLEWIFFAPVVSFFLYLAFVSRQALATFPRPSDINISNIERGLVNIFQNGVEIVVLAGIMIAGLIAAQSMSITGAKGAVGVLKKAGEGVQKGFTSYAQQRAIRGGARILASQPAQTAAGWIGQRFAALGGRMSNVGLNRGKVLRWATKPWRTAGQTLGGVNQGLVNLGPKAQAIIQQQSPTLLGSVFKGVSGAFGIKQWQCNSCLTVVGPSKKPPDKCSNNACPTNQAGSGVKLSWKTL